MHQILAKSHFPFCLLFPSSYSTQGRESQKVTENSVLYIYIIPESSVNSSETESSSESDSDDNIRKVKKALSALELNRIHKPKFSVDSCLICTSAQVAGYSACSAIVSVYFLYHSLLRFKGY
jgi:hypothetical protein